jgi:hypothetical protein
MASGADLLPHSLNTAQHAVSQTDAALASSKGDGRLAEQDSSASPEHGLQQIAAAKH